jgi:hypothetical protein
MSNGLITPWSLLGSRKIYGRFAKWTSTVGLAGVQRTRQRISPAGAMYGAGAYPWNLARIQAY